MKVSGQLDANHPAYVKHRAELAAE